MRNTSLTFANLTQQLAAAVFFIRRIKEPNLKFEKIFKLQFSQLRQALIKELKQFDGRSSTDVHVQYLRDVCCKVVHLSQWRSQRTHPRVQIDDNGIAIYDWRTRKPLSINRDECMEKIKETVLLTATLDQGVGSLLRELDEDKKRDEMWAEVFRTVEY